MTLPPSPRFRIDGPAADAAIEIERFASFSHPTRRFIAYAIQRVPVLAEFAGQPDGVAGNTPAPFVVGAKEAAERVAAYTAIPLLRNCRARGAEGQRQRRQEFGALLAMAKVDVRWKRLNDFPAFFFCYERLVGGEWRELLGTCWNEAFAQRRRKPVTQLPLVAVLRDDAAVPNRLEADRPPMFYPSMADADALGTPLLSGL